MKISTPDLLLVLAYLAGVVVFGAWIGRRQRSATDYILGGRDLPWWVVLFSIVATETSTVTFLSIPGFAYGRDLTWLQLPFGFLLGRLVVVAVLLPQYFAGKYFTAYEVLELRFGGSVKAAASALFIVTRSLADGLRLFLSAIVLERVAGVPLDVAIAALGLATICYTFLGGMRAVAWTDFVQFIVYMLGAACALAVLLSRIPGGLGGVLEAAGEAGKLRVLDFGLRFDDPYVFWAGTAGGLVLAIGSHGADQLMVQRYLSARSQRDAARALAVSGFVVLAQFAFFLLLGLALWAFYRLRDPVPVFASGDRVFAAFIVDELPVGVRGLVLGAVLAAAMSTLSSSLNSSATALVNDLLLPCMRATGDAVRLRATRIFTVVFGGVQIGVGVAGRWLTESVVDSVMAIAGFTTGNILGVFLLGTFTRQVRAPAAFVGLIAGLALVTSVKFATSLAWPWFALVGAATTFGVGVGAAALGVGRASRGSTP